MAENYKFHVNVKAVLDRIFVYDYTSRKLLCETTCVDPDATDEKIFNGEFPMEYKGMPQLLQCLGGEGTAEYTFNEIFSKPITDEKLAKMFPNAGDTKYLQRNCIVVNTPNHIKGVVVETPPYLREKLGLSRYIILLPTKKPEGQPSEKLARGFDPDPESVSFTQFVDVTIPSSFKEEYFKGQIFKVHCYTLSQNIKVVL